MKKKGIIIGAIVVMALLFTISYSITREILSKKDDSTVETVSNNLDELMPSTKIILKAIEEDTGMMMEYRSITLKEFEKEQGKLNQAAYASKNSLVEYLKGTGYALEKDNGGEIIFSRTMDNKSYEAGKYYLGVDEEGYICIYVAINSTKLVIENPKEDISGRKIEELPEYERMNIKRNSVSFSNREDALEYLSEYDS